MGDPALQSELVAWVREILKSKGWTPTALAGKAGIEPSTLTRRLNDPDHRFTFSLSTMHKIAEASGQSLPGLLTASRPSRRQRKRTLLKSNVKTFPDTVKEADISNGTVPHGALMCGTLSVAENGCITVPSAIGRQLGVEPGGTLMVRVSGDAIVIETIGASIRRAQDIVRRYVPAGTPLVEELIAERREAAERE